MKHTKKIVCGFMAMALAFPAAAPAQLLSLSNVLTVKAADQQQTGKTPDGYDYELWNQYGKGNVDMKLGSNGGFSCSWNGIENCLFRTGKKLGSTKGYKDYGNISINYDVDYKPDGNSYMCVYGWTEDPTVEYYIVEAWGTWRPPGNSPSKGTVSADGKKYDIYTSTRVNQPSIHGTETFEQYWSVNQKNPAKAYSSTHMEGTITVSDHFKTWEQSGMKMGRMYEVALNIEGYQSNGSATVNKNQLFIGAANPNPVTDPDTGSTPSAGSDKTPAGTAPAAGTGVTTGCESNAGGWTNRGEGVKLLLTGDQKHGGSKSLAVTGRSASWNGIQNSSSELKAGGLYSIEAYVTYDASYSSAGFTVGLQYDDASGKTQYKDIANAETTAGKWAKIGDAFTVPTDAKNISLYFQTTYSDNDTAADLINFYVDDIKLTDSMGNTGSTDEPGAETPETPQNPVTPGGTVSAGSIMADAKKNFTSAVPSDMKTGDTGKLTKIQYFSKKAQKNKPANVWLPAGYSENQKYPVVYMNHGVMGGEDDLTKGWAITEMASNLIKKGEVKPFIIVFPQMYTDPKADRPAGITQDGMDRYDDFLYDLTESLMPYMAEHYSVAEGRDNTAIAGFSMGGRESLYIGMMASDKIGYVAASSPAPGIIAAKDMFLDHRGSMTEAEFKFKTAPYLLMIGGGTNDTVVGTFPKQYHELYEKNGQDHIWFEVAGAGHDASVGTPLFYNFFRNIFKTESASAPQNPEPTAPPATQPVKPEAVKGDADGNGTVNSADVVALMQHLIGLKTLSTDQIKSADMNDDGKISVIDLIQLKNKLM